ncbi:MAG: DHH family phosphoesterase [Planctomycetota bacterium]
MTDRSMPSDGTGPAGDSSMPDAARAIARELERTRRVFIFTHIRPDGDAVGSGLALGAILREAGHEPEVILAEHMPRRYLFLEGSGAARRAGEVAADAQAVVFALDATGPDRLGDAAELFEAGAVKINIDHHVSNSHFGDVNWVEPGTGAVGEMVWRLAKEMGWSVPPPALDALYVAIMTDTGRFTFGNTTSGSLGVAAELVRSGACPEILAEEVYGHRTPAQWELERRARASLRFEHGGTVATLELTMRDFDETGTTPGDTDEFASLPRRQAGVEVGLFLYEIDDGARTKVGIRTSRDVDANLLAARLGGGGHGRAAGCTLDGPIDEARERILAETFRFLERE